MGTKRVSAWPVVGSAAKSSTLCPAGELKFGPVIRFRANIKGARRPGEPAREVMRKNVTQLTLC
jgi:hypothetical protein